MRDWGVTRTPEGVVGAWPAPGAWPGRGGAAEVAPEFKAAVAAEVAVGAA